MPFTISSSSSSSSSCSWRVRRVILFLDPKDEVGPSISSSVVLCFFVFLVYIVVLVLVVCLCPSSVHVVAAFPGTVLFAIYDIMWLKYGEAWQDTDDNIIGCMLFACWITKAIHTHTHTHTLRICNTNCSSMATIATRTSLNVKLICTLAVLLDSYYFPLRKSSILSVGSCLVLSCLVLSSIVGSSEYTFGRVYLYILLSSGIPRTL